MCAQCEPSPIYSSTNDYAIVQIGRLKFCTVWFIINEIIHFALFLFFHIGLAKLVRFEYKSPTKIVSSRARMSCTVGLTHTQCAHRDFFVVEVIESDRSRSTRDTFGFWFNGKTRKCIYIWCAFDFDYDFICFHIALADVNKKKLKWFCSTNFCFSNGAIQS